MNDLINEIINEVEKHHNMKMSTKCAEGLLNIIIKKCPHLNKIGSCPCDPWECAANDNCCKDDSKNSNAECLSLIHI